MSDLMDIKEIAVSFSESIKEFYMNYSLREHDKAMFGSAPGELEFYALNDDFIKRNSAQSMETPGKEDSMDKKLSYEDPQDYYYTNFSKDNINRKQNPFESISEFKENNDKLWNSGTIHLGLKNPRDDFSIITIIKSPYLTTKIIIRDITGKHSWLIKEHRVLEYNFIDTIDYNDKVAVYKNAIAIKNDQNLKDILVSNKNIKDLEEEKIKEIEINAENELSSFDGNLSEAEEELKTINDKEILFKINKLLCKNFPDIKNVILLLFSSTKNY